MSKTTNGKPSIFFSKSLGTVKSPAGTALFASLTEPDSFRGGDPTWKISLVFDPADPEFLAFKKTVEDFAVEFAKDCGGKVDAAKVFSSDKNTGNPMMTFKSKVKIDEAGRNIPMVLVDSQKNPIDKEPWNGDICRVAFTLGGWQSAFGTGIKPYLSAVQVVERKPRSGGSFKSVDVFDAPTVVDDCPF